MSFALIIRSNGERSLRHYFFFALAARGFAVVIAPLFKRSPLAVRRPFKRWL